MVRRACVCIYLVWYGPTEGFKDWKNLKRLDHIEGEDGQACAFFTCAFLVWSDLDQYWMGLNGTVIPEVPPSTQQYLKVSRSIKMYPEVDKNTQ